jgi:hypothetical protein
MDENFFEALNGYQEKLDLQYSGCVQIQNTSGMLLRITNNCYLRNYGYAIVSRKNNNLEKLLKKRKIKSHQFELVKAPKTKKKVDKAQTKTAKTQETKQSIDVSELSAMFTMVPNNNNQDKI